MRTHLLLAATLLAPGTTASAQAHLRPRASLVSPALIPVDPARVADALARADVSAQEGRMREARKIYQALIAEQTAAEEFSGTAMWRLALNYLYADEPQRAATQLDQLAVEAAKYGDPTLELRATFEAAALWQKLKRPDMLGDRVGRVRALLQSPAIPEADKANVRQRMQ